MTLLGSVMIPAGPWIWFAIGVLIIVTLLLVRSYRRAGSLNAACAIAFCLKLIGISVLVLCLVEPLWSGRRAKSGANLFLVVADNSSSMTIRDRGATFSRREILKSVLGGETSDWFGVLAENFEVRQYIFDSRLHRTTDFSELIFDGSSSEIGAALRTIAERYRDRPMAGILLLTDGSATDMSAGFPQGGGPGQIFNLTGVPPVYPVLIGGDRPQRDICLANVSVSQTSFEDAPVTIQADVEAVGYAGRSVTIALNDDSGNLVESRQWNIKKDDEKQSFHFRLRPAKTGIIFYRVHAEDSSRKAWSQIQKQDPAKQSEELFEATLLNNDKTVIVSRGKGPYRILYVTGRPNWEFKFLSRAISEDEQVQLVGLIRVAKREPKYDWRGHAGEQTNPLYRGFDPKDTEQTEQYDQPVLIRLNTRDADELRDGFPKTEEELFGYHAVILDDIEAEFFTNDQMNLLRRFVAERGGGFLMLAGKESFRQGSYDRTPIAGILPVYLDIAPDPSPVTRARAGVRMLLTRQGWFQPWARLRDNEQAEQQRFSNMPEFLVLNRVMSTRPGARVIAVADGAQDRQYPALIVQRFGNGRAGALTIGDMWRWGLRQADMREDRDKFWRQTLRWLVSDVPDRVTIQPRQNPDQLNQPVLFQVRARDEKFQPMDNIAVAIDVNEPDGKKVRVTTEPSLSEPGLFEAAYVPRISGGFVARATVADRDSNLLGDAEAGWAVDIEGREFRSIKTNRPLLENIARQTGGKVVEPEELADFARNLPGSDVPVTEGWISPLWDLPGMLPAIFLFALACFAAEWALRRWKGMQ